MNIPDKAIDAAAERYAFLLFGNGGVTINDETKAAVREDALSILEAAARATESRTSSERG